MLKKIVLTFFLLILTITAYAEIANTRTLLVLDMRNAPEFPKHFRISHALENSNIDWTGFENLKIAGGAQFSKMSLSRMLQVLRIKKMVVIDLREESHGFLNGNAVSWYGPHNAANKDLTPSEVEANQANLLAEVNNREDASIIVYKIIKKSADGNIEKTKEIEFGNYQTSSERDFLESMQLNYQRIYVRDFHGPKDTEVDRFIQITKQLPKNRWIYFHCRAGKGRSTTFMIMYDMLHNAKQVSFDDILARQVAIGGKDLTELPKAGTYKYKPALKRLNFLKKFYEYVRSNNDNFTTTWSEWIRKYKDKS